MNNLKTFKNFNNIDIFEFIDKYNIQAIKDYINSGYDLNVQDKYGNNPLHCFIIYNDVINTKLLIDAGVNIDKQNNNGDTALIRVAMRNNLKIAELLLDSGTDIDKQNNNGDTALISSAKINNRKMVELLLDYHADEFILNIDNKSFFDYLNDTNKRYFIKEYPNKVYNAILYKYKKPFTEFVKDYNLIKDKDKEIFEDIHVYNIKSIIDYINSGYDLNVLDDNGNTPLIYATKFNVMEIFKLFLNAGADTNIQNYDGDTALIISSTTNNLDFVKLLLENGADSDKQNNGGNTALIAATFYNNIEIVELLLNAGADINKQNNKGYTALINSARSNYREIVELLLDYHADEFILNDKNKSFYDYLNTENKEYFTQNYPTNVYNAISNNYKKSFTEFVKDYNIKNNKI